MTNDTTTGAPACSKYELYKAAVQLRPGEKAPATQYKNIPAADLPTVKQMYENGMDFAGILAQDAVLYDFDDIDDFQAALKVVKADDLNCRVIRSQSDHNGGHILLRQPVNRVVNKDGAGLTLACGIHADIKLGKKEGLEALCVNGVQRAVIREIDETRPISEAPVYFRPLGILHDQTLAGMKDGDGRNNALFYHAKRMVANGIKRNEVRDIAEVINACVFGEPLPEGELDVVCRLDVLPDELPENIASPATRAPSVYDENGRFAHDVCAQYLLRTLHACRIDAGVNIGGVLHIWMGTHYEPGEDTIKAMIIELAPKRRKKDREEVLDYMMAIAPKKQRTGGRYITFRNGVYDLQEQQLIDFNPDIISTNIIPHPYKPDAKSERLEHLLETWADGDPECYDRLIDNAAAILYSGLEIPCSIFVTGAANAGKSTLLKLYKAMVGRDNTSAIPLNCLSRPGYGNKFYGKLLNVVDDATEGRVSSEDVALFKSLATHDEITVRGLYHESVTFEPYGTFATSCNSIAKMYDDDPRAVYRRMWITILRHPLPLNGPHKDKVSNMIWEDELSEALIAKAVPALIEMKAYRNGPRPYAAGETYLAKYFKEMDTVAMFVEDEGDAIIINHTPRDVYTNYTLWCNANGYRSPLTKTNLTKRLQERYGYEVKQIHGGARVFRKVVTPAKSSDKAKTI